MLFCVQFHKLQLDNLSFFVRVGWFTYEMILGDKILSMRWIGILLGFTIFIAACAPVGQIPQASEPTAPSNPDVSTDTGTPQSQNPSGGEESTSASDEPGSSVQINKRIDDPNEYSFPQLIPFDGIRPVYDPQFVSAQDAPLFDDELVIGIALEDEAKAYPITVLRVREMVNDELAGIPTLVTW